jgi:hypothetical protein
MAGYIGAKQGVTQVDGYNRSEADAEFVQTAGDTMTGNLVAPMVVTDSALSSRNMVINGAMQIWQRATSRTLSNTQYVAVDRFQPGQFQQAGYERVEVVGPGPQAQYALRVTSSSTSEAASGTRMAVGQMIEHANSIHTAGQAVTLSFWIKFSAASIAGAGDFLVRIWEFDSINPSFTASGPTRDTGIDLTNGSLPTSWTKYTITATTASTAKTLAPRFSFNTLFNTTNNSDFSYDITEIQLEQGDTATPFEHRSLGAELALCQRYYEEQSVFSSYGNATYVSVCANYKVSKRVTPTTVIVDVAGNTDRVSAIPVSGAALVNNIAQAASSGTVDYFRSSISGGSGTYGGSSFTVKASAEL